MMLRKRGERLNASRYHCREKEERQLYKAFGCRDGRGREGNYERTRNTRNPERRGKDPEAPQPATVRRTRQPRPGLYGRKASDTTLLLHRLRPIEPVPRNHLASARCRRLPEVLVSLSRSWRISLLHFWSVSCGAATFIVEHHEKGRGRPSLRTRPRSAGRPRPARRERDRKSSRGALRASRSSSGWNPKKRHLLEGVLDVQHVERNSVCARMNSTICGSRTDHGGSLRPDAPIRGRHLSRSGGQMPEGIHQERRGRKSTRPGADPPQGGETVKKAAPTPRAVERLLSLGARPNQVLLD